MRWILFSLDSPTTSIISRLIDACLRFQSFALTFAITEFHLLRMPNENLMYFERVHGVHSFEFAVRSDATVVDRCESRSLAYGSQEIGAGSSGRCVPNVKPLDLMRAPGTTGRHEPFFEGDGESVSTIGFYGGDREPLRDGIDEYAWEESLQW